MIITKAGKRIVNKWVSKVIICPRCACEFRLEEKDRQSEVEHVLICPNVYCKYKFVQYIED